MIETHQLCKNYDGKPAVIDLELSIRPGECFCFLGPNGAGKTTTIKMLTGLLVPTSGRALVAGYDLQADPVEAKRRIGYIPDRPYLYEKLTGRDFFTFVGDLFGIDRARQQAQLDRYFELFRLTHAVDDFIEDYSHGHAPEAGLRHGAHARARSADRRRADGGPGPAIGAHDQAPPA